VDDRDTCQVCRAHARASINIGRHIMRILYRYGLGYTDRKIVDAFCRLFVLGGGGKHVGGGCHVTRIYYNNIFIIPSGEPDAKLIS